jgi:hypothetical protein
MGRHSLAAGRLAPFRWSGGCRRVAEPISQRLFIKTSLGQTAGLDWGKGTTGTAVAWVLRVRVTLVGQLAVLPGSQFGLQIAAGLRI